MSSSLSDGSLPGEHDRSVPAPIYARLPAQVIDAVADRTRRRRYHAGQLLWFEGDPGDSLLILESGRLRTSRLYQDGRETTLDVVEPVSLLGESSLFSGAPRDTTLIALRDVTVRHVPRQALLDAIDADPAVATLLIAYLVETHRRAAERYEHAISWGVHRRLRHWLKERAVNPVDRRSRSGARVLLDRTQGELASELWTTRSTLNRAFHELEESGEIRIDGNVVVLLRRFSTNDDETQPDLVDPFPLDRLGAHAPPERTRAELRAD